MHRRPQPLRLSNVNGAVHVDVGVGATMIVAVHVNGNATVGVIGPL